MSFQPKRMNRLYAKFAIDALVWLGATPMAYLLRFDEAWSGYMDSVLLVSLLVVPLKAGVVIFERHFLQSWRRVGLRDLFAIMRGVGVYGLLFFVGAVLFRERLFVPLSVPFIEAMLLVLGLGSVRLATRLWYEYKFQRDPSSGRRARRVLIAGAGEAGTMIAREMLRNPDRNMRPVGFLDDDPSKRRQSFLGLEVLGGTDDVRHVIENHAVDVLLIAMPAESGEVIRRIIAGARDSEVAYKIIPSIHELITGEVTVNHIRDVDVEDLLRRKPVELDTGQIAGYLEGKVVMVTGAGGSIGSEIVRQIIPYRPERILLLDNNEFGLYSLQLELDNGYGKEIDFRPVIADVRDRPMLRSLFERESPQVVFHAAAHKHVELMEQNPSRAILNNVEGTRAVAELALEHGIEHFVNISTDKAVKPSSVMGASKRLAEWVVARAGERASGGEVFVSVRFGNVLGSSGSVIPRFKRQIRRREPVTVTHPEMTRYFMTIPEASQLVLQAGGLKQSGVVYILDMGEPIPIVELAEELIRLSGLEPGADIPITFTGIRQGEKLQEELMTPEESERHTRYEKIHVAAQNGLPEDFEERLEELIASARADDRERMGRLLRELIPDHQLGHSFS